MMGYGLQSSLLLTTVTCCPWLYETLLSSARKDLACTSEERCEGLGSRHLLSVYNFDCMAKLVWTMVTSSKPASHVMGPALYT